MATTSKPSVTASDGSRIAYEIRGTGRPALVLVHGWSCNRGYWSAAITDLAQDALVVALDLAGHGESHANRTDWSIAAFGADVTSVVDALDLEEVILVGHSMGADVVLQAARGLVGRVRGMVWVDEYGQLDRFRDEQQVRERIAPFKADFVSAADAFVRRLFAPSSDPALVDRVAANISSAPPRVAVPALEATWNHARMVPALLEELQLPVMAINSPGARTDFASLRRHGIQAVVMPGVGHFPMLEQPEAFNVSLATAKRALACRSPRS